MQTEHHKRRRHERLLQAGYWLRARGDVAGARALFEQARALFPTETGKADTLGSTAGTTPEASHLISGDVGLLSAALDEAGSWFQVKSVDAGTMLVGAERPPRESERRELESERTVNSSVGQGKARTAATSVEPDLFSFVAAGAAPSSPAAPSGGELHQRLLAEVKGEAEPSSPAAEVALPRSPEASVVVEAKRAAEPMQLTAVVPPSSPGASVVVEAKRAAEPIRLTAVVPPSSPEASVVVEMEGAAEPMQLTAVVPPSSSGASVLAEVRSHAEPSWAAAVVPPSSPEASVVVEMEGAAEPMLVSPPTSADTEVRAFAPQVALSAEPASPRVLVSPLTSADAAVRTFAPALPTAALRSRGGDGGPGLRWEPEENALALECPRFQLRVLEGRFVGRVVPLMHERGALRLDELDQRTEQLASFEARSELWVCEASEGGVYLAVDDEVQVGTQAWIRAGGWTFRYEKASNSADASYRLHALDTRSQQSFSMLVTSAVFAVGREGCELCLPADPALAPRHFELTPGPWASFLAGCSAEHRTYLRLGGARRRLREGEVFYAGELLVKVEPFCP